MIKLNKKFIVDESGQRTEVVIPYRDYERLMEDIHDLAIVAERKDEKTTSHEEMTKRLKEDGLI